METILKFAYSKNKSAAYLVRILLTLISKVVDQLSSDKMSFSNVNFNVIRNMIRIKIRDNWTDSELNLKMAI